MPNSKRSNSLTRNFFKSSYYRILAINNGKPTGMGNPNRGEPFEILIKEDDSVPVEFIRDYGRKEYAQ